MHAPGRYANLRRIQQLDPEVDHDEILRLTARHEFPWDYVQGTGIAFMRDHGTKRYDDTTLIGDEATLDGIDSPRRTPYLHRPTTYPSGHRLEDLGPIAMLDDLNRDTHGKSLHA